MERNEKARPQNERPLTRESSALVSLDPKPLSVKKRLDSKNVNVNWTTIDAWNIQEKELQQEAGQLEALLHWMLHKQLVKGEMERIHKWMM